ncbi:unnamed protein product [Ceutorhynchus assimilis]|uniref:protein-tyrosine-phosphatase n=1 Tax=Ceutorhynchus assimilis TaxID=467358 RepID=A0A9P0DJ32_9CUCU|nr:unnamed protein product [Ceutorhynchus assimilis]
MCFCILSPHLLQKYLAQTALLTIIEKQCITNTSSAVAPIYNLDEKLWPKPEYFTQNVKYVGRKTNLLKHCVPSPGSRCFDNSWIIKNSLSHSRINNLITDRRWEELPTFVTKDIHKYGMDMYYDKVTTINSHNFMLPFSVLIKYEAHLFLCDGPDVSSYNCYWFMIDAWNGKSSAIRVCDSGNIQKQYEGGKPPSGICGSSTADYKLDASILSKTKWTHLKIVANNYKLKLINEEGRVLINATNLQRNIIPGHVIIHSKRVIGMWKMHTFDYFYSDSEGTTEFKLDVGSGQRCLSMLSSMCNKCTMLIQILTYFWKWKYSDNILYSRELPNDANGNWQEHKFHFNTEEATVYIRINKSGSAGKSNFWAVSDIRTCETNELRITQIDDQNKWTRKCQHLATGEIMDLDEPKIEKLEDRNKCNEYQFGEDCISCKTIFGQNLCPKQSKYCQLVATENSNILRKRCFCSIGSAGRNCKDSCLASNYGHGCSGNCKNCQDTCSRDPIFGKCDSKFCTDNFQGEKCDQPSIIFIFSQEPKIEPEYRSCKVTLKSFDGTGIKVGMQFYKFQYRKKGQSEWKNTTSVPFNEIRMIEITGLEVQSNYELRMFGYKEIPNMDEMRFIENENILPTYTFQTICRDPKSNDISIITDAFSATITYLKAIDQELCDIDAYTNNVNGTTINISNEANPYKMINLKPFSLYIFSISKNLNNIVSKEFRTLESAPGKPYGLSYSWTYENFLYLEWFLPNETNGKLTGFDVFVDGIPHEYNLDPQEEYKLKYNKTIQENFKLPKQYAVRITARNLAGTSEPDVIFTKKSPPPIPSNSIISTDRTENSLRVIFNEPDTPMYYQRFFYGLITECDTCDDDLVIEFKKVLMDHHISYDEVETKTTISFWKRVINYKYQQPTEKFLSINISNTTMNYAIKKSATYLVAFIWINKEQGFIRSKYTLIKSKGQSIRHPDGNLGSIGIASIVVLTLFLIVMLAVIGVRYKTPLINKVRSIFAAKEQDRRITESSISLNPTADEVRYVNRQELKMSGYKSGRRASRCIRPLSVLFTEEICPGVPQFKTIHSKRIKLEDLRQYVKQAIESGELATQHAAFPKGQTKPWDYGKLPENKTKNRYQNLIAYDHSRVVLNKFDRDEYSDYINANYIDGYQRPKAYIATQGPKPNTVKDFWQMIWEEKATHIVMMANVIEGNKKKTEQYWPNVNEEVTFGDYKITFIHSEIHAHYEYRKFKVQFKYSTPRQVAQLHFKVWPDHGVPLYPQTLIPFLQRLLILRSWDFPLVVHCSAGVGRTGTIILCDICLRMAASEGSVDIFSMLEHLRNQRPNMVDNIEQYKLAHLVILNCLMGLNTSIPIDEDFENSAKKIKNIDHQLNYIRDCEWEDEAMKTVAFYDDEELPFDPTKNRFAHIIPDKAASVFLLPISTQSNSAYINAVHVDGFCHPRRFIVTEFPLPHTIGDFWRLIAERDISVVICLNEIPVNDLTCKLFWPKHNKNLVPNEIIEVKHIQSKNLQSYSIMNFELSSYYEHRGKETKEVQIVKFHGWNYPDIIDHSDFFTFVEEAMMIGRHSNQILVTCYDGVTACGLFTAMSFLIEKIKLEQECDVCQAIRTIRTSRKQFCNTKDQLQFLYKASILYVQERFQTYSNINMKK